MEKNYILTVKNSGQYGGVNIALADAAHVVEILSALCDYATNPLDFEIETVRPTLEELSDEMPKAMTEGELNKALAETYDNLKFD